jgi:hypothetical protein
MRITVLGNMLVYERYVRLFLRDTKRRLHLFLPKGLLYGQVALSQSFVNPMEREGLVKHVATSSRNGFGPASQHLRLLLCGVVEGHRLLLVMMTNHCSPKVVYLVVSRFSEYKKQIV